MDNQLKQLLLKVATLPLSDQRWLLKQLTPKQKRVFASHKGTSLLYKARRFAKLPLPTQQLFKSCLPELCQELKNQPPLYVAIILEQGDFSWGKPFLAKYLQQQSVPFLPMDALGTLKTATKLALFKQWQQNLNFADQLEVHHGSSI